MPTTFSLPTTDGQPAQQLTLPTFWPDVTLGQYLALTAAGAAPAEQLLTGLTAAQWAALDEASQQELSQRLLFLTDTQPLAELPPTPGLYAVGRSAYGLRQQAQQQLAALPAEAPPLARAAVLYALYREPAGSTASPAHYEAAHAAVLVAPITAVYADCVHFLTSYHAYLTGQPSEGAEQPGLLRLADAQGRPLAGGPTPKPATRRGLLAGLFPRATTSLIR